MDAIALTPFRVQATRTEFGRPSSNVRFQGINSDRHLGCPTLVGARAWPIAGHLLVARHRRFGPDALVATGGFLPGHASMLGNMLEVAVALHWCGPGHFARHCV